LSKETGLSMMQIRKNFGLERDEFGRFLGYAERTIRSYEEGSREISLDLAYKLTKDYPWSLEEFAEGNIPEIDLSRPDISEIPKSIDTVFPIFEDDSAHNTDFDAAYHWHTQFYKVIQEPKGSDKTDSFVYYEDMIECKNNYMRAMHDPSVRLYAVANFVSLVLIYASIIDSYSHQDDSLMTYTINRKANPNNEHFLSKESINNASKELHQKKIYGILHNYIDELSKHEQFSDLSSYYSALLYQMNLVDNNNSWIENVRESGIMLFQLSLSGNPYAKCTANILYGVYHNTP